MTAVAERAALSPSRNTSVVASARAPKIGILYPSGAGNLGDEAILEATFAAIRTRWPDAQIKAFTLHPQRTAANHRVDAEPLTGINRKLFGVPRPDGPLPIRAAAAIARRTRKIPLIGRAARWSSYLLSTLVYETTSLRRAWSWLRTADLVLASGGGQLDAVWGGTWGQPYALARWAFLARRANVPFAFLSVGYGGTPTRLSRRFMRYAVSRSAYCSVRDAGSRALAEQLGVTQELPIVPDLAFALQADPPLRPRRPGYDVAVSPMVYLRPGSWPIEDEAEYRKYVALWASLISDRVALGDRVHLFVTDPADMDAVDDVIALLDADTKSNCFVDHAITPRELLEFFRRMDVVVSSRLHGVLLSIVAGRPVLALSHERKVRTLMKDVEMPELALELKTTTPPEIGSTLETLVSDLDSHARRLRSYAAAARRSVARQEELLPQLLRKQ